MNEPKILFWDIETAPNLAAIWSLKVYGGYIGPEHLVKEHYMLSAAWKFRGEAQVKKLVCKDGVNDLELVKELKADLEGADIIIGHNGDRFDLPRLRGRLLIHKLKPLRAIVTMDTLKMAKRKFSLNAYGLEYLAHLFGYQIPKNQPGIKVWLQAMAGDVQALETISTYNAGDVNMLEYVFEELLPHCEYDLKRAVNRVKYLKEQEGRS